MFNKVVLVGRLGADPDRRFTPSGQAVTNFRMAVSRQYTRNGERVEETVWVRVTAWGKLAEVVGEYLQKGRMVLVEGRLEPASAWIDKASGEARASVEVTAETVKFLSGRSNGQTEEGPQASEVVEDMPF